MVRGGLVSIQDGGWGYGDPALCGVGGVDPAWPWWRRCGDHARRGVMPRSCMVRGGYCQSCMVRGDAEILHGAR